MHRRTIALAPRAWVLIVDDIIGIGSHRVESMVHWDIGANVEKVAPDRLRLTQQGREYTFLAIEFEEMRLFDEDNCPPNSWYSPQFGQKIPRKCTQISSWCDAPTRLAYAIIHGSPETVRFEAAPDAEEFHVQIDEHRWLISADWKARKANIQTTFGRPQTANRVLSPVVRSGRRAQHPK